MCAFYAPPVPRLRSHTRSSHSLGSHFHVLGLLEKGTGGGDGAGPPLKLGF